MQGGVLLKPPIPRCTSPTVGTKGGMDSPFADSVTDPNADWFTERVAVAKPASLGPKSSRI